MDARMCVYEHKKRRNVCQSVWVYMNTNGRMCVLLCASIEHHAHMIANMKRATIEETIYKSLQIDPLRKEGKRETHYRRWKQKPQRKSDYCLVSSGLLPWLASPSVLSYLSSTAQVHAPKNSPMHNGLRPPSLIVIEAMIHSTTVQLTKTVPALRY